MSIKDLIGRTVADCSEAKDSGCPTLSITFTDGANITVMAINSCTDYPVDLGIGIILPPEAKQHPPDCLCDTCICSCGHRQHGGSCRKHKEACNGCTF